MNDHTNDHAPTPNTGENPHAEIAPLPPVDFRTNARAWIEQNIGSDSTRSARYGSSPSASAEYVGRAFAAIGALLDSLGEPNTLPPAEIEALAALLVGVRGALGYRVGAGGDSRFVRFGPLVIPASPRGFALARRFREIGSESVQSSALGVVDESSTLGVLLALLRSQAERSTSGILQSVANRTSPHTSANDHGRGAGFVLAFDFHARSTSAIPSGLVLPPALLSPTLDGYEIDDPLELVRDADMCADGTAEFCERFGIGFERSGSYECGECGCEHESDESGEIESVDSFVLDSSMIEAIDAQGFGDALRDYVAGGDETDTLGALLESCDDSEIRERLTVPPTLESGKRDGIEFDPLVWSFAPDFDEIDGSDEIESSEALRAGALLGSIVADWTGANLLPPIPGTLNYRPQAYERPNSSRDTIALAWCPKSGTLETAIGGGLRLRFNVRSGARTLLVPDPSRGSRAERTVSIALESGSWNVHAPSADAGERAALLLSIARAGVEI